MNFISQFLCLIGLHNFVQYKSKFKRRCKRCGLIQHRWPWDMNHWYKSNNQK